MATQKRTSKGFQSKKEVIEKKKKEKKSCYFLKDFPHATSKIFFIFKHAWNWTSYGKMRKLDVPYSRNTKYEKPCTFFSLY